MEEELHLRSLSGKSRPELDLASYADTKHQYDATIRKEYAELLGMMEKTKDLEQGHAELETHSAFAAAGYFSRVFFFWIFSMTRALVRGEVSADTMMLAEKDRTSSSSDVFRKFWFGQLEKDNPSLFSALKGAFYPKFARAFLLKVLWGIIMVITNSVMINLFITAHADAKAGKDTLAERYVLAAVFFVFPCLLGFFLHHCESMCIRLGIRIRAALVTAIYHKALTAKVTNMANSPILSLFTKDCGVMLYAPLALIRLVTGILEIVLLIAVLCFYLRWDVCLFIVAVTAICIPIQYWLSQKVTQIREDNTASNNERLLIVHEVLYAIKLVKFYTWEDSFTDKISRIRQGELKGLRTAAAVKSTNYMIIIVHNIVCAVGAFLIYALDGIRLSPAVAFLLVNVCNSFRFPIFYLPVAIKTVYEAYYSTRKIQDFLLEEDRPAVEEAPEDGVYFDNVTMTHAGAENSTLVSHAKVEPFYVKNLSFSVKRGTNVAIIGPFGSGKSSIFYGILGDMKLSAGSLQIKGSIAYVPQTPWIMHGTVRDNILFGKAFDYEWYLKVVRACCLIPDFRQFQDHDFSYLSENGINLSGGQRQRIALARAVYAKADIYLLDSVLSALDPGTGRLVFDRVVKGLLKESAVLMVTHNLDTIPECDQIVVMKEGEALYCGPYDDSAVRKVFPEEEKVEGKEDSTKVTKRTSTAREHQILLSMLNKDEPREDEATDLLVADRRERGLQRTRSKAPEQEEDQKAELLKTIWRWGQYGSLPGIAFAASLFFLAQCVRVFMDFWLRFWLNDVLDWGTDRQASLEYVAVYAGLLLTFAILVELRAILWYFYSFVCATNMHNAFLKTIFHAPMLFFSKEPLGKILKAYSKDQDQVDDAYPDASHFMLFFTSIVLTTIVSLCIVNIYFVALGAFVIIMWLLLQNRFSQPINLCKSSVSKTDGVALVHASETLHGMPVIRAFGVEAIMARENEVCLDAYGASVFHLEHVTLWSALIFDVIASLFVCFTALITIWDFDTLSAAQVGQLLAGATQLLVFLALMVNMINETQYQLFSVARILNYVRATPSEDFSFSTDMPKDSSSRPNFPHGQVVCSEVDMAYDPHKGLVLKKLSAEFKAGERIGICGRTGSGKSSLINAIFRLTEICNGTIHIDDLNTRALYMKDLRKSISIIPQEPVVFRGTIRSNLDPFHEHTDEELKTALRSSHLLDAIMAMPGGLDAEVSEGGSNMSVGQRQLLCLTRVVLRKDRRILVLDEATSALDPVTDQMIQKTIREEFNDHTILTIAHRLQTIIDYDKILVLGHGEVLEFDSVPNLMANPYGQFRAMYEAGNPDHA